MKKALLLSLVFIASSIGLWAVDPKIVRSDQVFHLPGDIALADAAAKGNCAQVRKLVKLGQKVDVQGRDGVTPLMWAIFKRSKVGVTCLVENGADPNLLTPFGISAMSIAAAADDSSFLRVLLQHKGDPNLVDPTNGSTPIFDSVNNGRPESVGLLIASGADLNHHDNESGDTPLHAAVYASEYEIACELIKAGADPLAKNNHGVMITRTVARDHYYVKGSKQDRGRTKLIECLAAKGVEVNPTSQP